MINQQKLACGGISGVLSCSLTAPIDRIRLLMMTTESQLSMSGAYQKATAPGTRALWMGNGVACVKIAPEMGIMLYSFDTIKEYVAQDPNNITPAERFVAGGCAGAIAEMSIYPMSVLRTRLATGVYQGFQDCAMATYQKGGVKAFYGGLTPSIIGIIPYAGFDLGINSLLKDQAKKQLNGFDQDKPLPIPVMLSCGMISSATASVLTFPIVVVRTRAQATGLPILMVVRGLAKEGIPGFYRGLVPSLMKVMPTAAITYTSYDWLKARLKADK